MDTIVKLIMQTSERSTAMKAQSVIASDHNYLKSCAATSSLAECEHLSMDAQLWECRAHFAPHVAVSLERTIQRCNDYLVEPGHNNGFVVTKAGFAERGVLGKTQFSVSYNVESQKYECLHGCGKATFKGKPCVHMVKVFQHLGLPLFQATYVHDHWKIMKNWNFDGIKQRCGNGNGNDEEDGENEDYGASNDDDSDGDGQDRDLAGSDALSRNPSVETNLHPSLQTSKENIRSTSVVLSKNRYAFGKKLFDQVAAFFANKDIFHGFVDVLRTFLVTCSSTDLCDGFARIKSYVTVDPRLQKQKDNTPTLLLPAVQRKEGRRKQSSRGKMVRPYVLHLL